MPAKMRSAITVCLVPEAASGPFVLHGELAEGCRIAAELGFDAVEVFPADPADPQLKKLPQLLDQYSLQLAAMGTGGAWLRHQWTLTSRDASIRQQAFAFVKEVINVAGSMQAPAIIGSLQGRIGKPEERAEVLAQFADDLRRLSQHAWETHQQPLLFEPLNRYESNVWNRLPETASWLEAEGLVHVQLLADLFHMNIEEASLEATVEALGSRIGHVHFADSNRQAIGYGHTSMEGVMAALNKIGYQGYLSAEIFPIPNQLDAAKQTLASFRRLREISA